MSAPTSRRIPTTTGCSTTASNSYRCREHAGLPRQLGSEVQARLNGERVGAVVLHVGSVSAHPAPLDDVNLAKLQEPAPEVLVLHRLPLRRPPAVPLPIPGPSLRERVVDVLRVGPQLDLARLLQGLQSSNGAETLHPVVRSVGLGASQFLPHAVLLRKQHHSPTSDARVR